MAGAVKRVALFGTVVLPVTLACALVLVVLFVPLNYTFPRVFLRVRQVMFALWAHTMLNVLMLCIGTDIYIYLPSDANVLKKTLEHLSPQLLKALLSYGGSASDDFRRAAKAAIRKSSFGPTIVIANHQVYTDWIFIWSLMAWSGMAGSVYIILKRSLVMVPIIGLAMKVSNFVFIRRNWALDCVKFIRRIRRIDETEQSRQLIIFPEGVTLCEDGIRKMLAYIQRLVMVKPMTPNVHCLLPRATGLRTVLSETVSKGILDLTIGYEGLRQDLYPEDQFGSIDLYIRGEGPKGVHFYLQFWTLADVPLEGEAFSDWLYSVFKAKDALLGTFYKTGRMQPSNFVVMPVAPQAKHAALFVYSLASMFVMLTAMLVTLLRK